MKPSKIKHLFEHFGKVGRIFLRPENPEIRKKRKKGGGNSKKNFTEGWVEFEDKKIAKLVALSLNNTSIGGKKRNYYRDDIWNVKYLSKFKWYNLTERIAYEKAVREKKLRQSISSGKRENEEYRKRVEKTKVERYIQERKRARLEANTTSTTTSVTKTI